MSRNAVYPGIVAPASTRYDLTTDDPAFDLSTVTAARLVVLFDDETTATWDCTFGAIPGVAAANGVRLTRLHQADDIPEGAEGKVMIRADCDIAGGLATGDWRTVPVERAGT